MRSLSSWYFFPSTAPLRMRIGSSQGGLKLAENYLEIGRCFHYHLVLIVILPTTQTKVTEVCIALLQKKKVSND